MTVTQFPEAAPAQFPALLKESIDAMDWESVERMVRNGVRADLYSKQEVASVVEYTMRIASSYLETSDKKVLPVSLLEAFFDQGLTPEKLENGMGLVARAAQHGQWGWVEYLLDANCPVEAPEAERGALWAFMRGQAMRHQLASFSMLAAAAFGSWEEETEEESEPSPPADLPDNVSVLPIVQKRNSADRFEKFVENAAERVNARWQQLREHSNEATQVLCRLLEHGACAERLDSPLRWSYAGQMTPLEQALSLKEKDWAEAILLERPDLKIRPETLAVLVNSSLSKETNLVDELVARLPSEVRLDALKNAAFGSMLSRSASMAALLEHLPLSVVDDQGWTLLQRAAEVGKLSAIQVLVALGGELEQAPETGPSPADLLRLHHPEICEPLNVPLAQESSNVRVLRPRSRF